VLPGVWLLDSEVEECDLASWPEAVVNLLDLTRKPGRDQCHGFGVAIYFREPIIRKDRRVHEQSDSIQEF
jgi:hypothetical protein